MLFHKDSMFYMLDIVLIYIYLQVEELCSGIANGRMLNLKLYTHRRQKLTLLHLFTDLFETDL